MKPAPTPITSRSTLATGAPRTSPSHVGVTSSSVVGTVIEVMATPRYLVWAHGTWTRLRCGPIVRRTNHAQEAHPVAVSAYVLIQTEVGKAAQVAEEVSGIEGVVSAEDVTGPYDVIARAEATSVDELGKMVVSRVQMIDGITRTLTCPIVHL